MPNLSGNGLFWPLLLLVSLVPRAVSAQDDQTGEPAGCEIGVDCASGAVAEEDGPVDSKLSKDFVTVAIADSLDEDRVAVEAALRANPNIRIAGSLAQSEYLLARYPDFPDNLILVPASAYQFLVAGPPPSEDAPDVNEVIANLFARTDGTRGMYRLPPVIGRLDDNSLAAGLNAEIHKTLWSRRILGGPIPRLRDDVTTEIFGPKKAICTIADEAKQCALPYWTVVRNEGSEPAHIAILRIDQAFAGTDSYVPLKNKTSLRLAPGESRMIGNDDFEGASEANRGHIITIASDQPIDLSLFDPRDGKLPRIPEAWTVTATQVPHRTISVRIGGGFKVANLATPWQVQLYSTESSTPPSLLAAGRINWQLHEKTHRCGGSLIELNIVLTAAHCIANEPFASPEKRQTVFKYRRVKLGTKDLTRGGTTYAIDAVIVKKGYVPGGNHHDIALIKLKPDASTVARAATVADRIQLASRPPAPETIVSAYGWGVMEEVSGRNTRIASTGTAQRNPAELRTGELQILDQNKCRARAGYGHVSNLMLCGVTPRNSEAARQGRHVFTCLGDSGGPIMGRENGRMVQVGVVSWAVGCGVNDNPSVSANVAAYADWINTNKTKFESGKSIER